MRNLRDLSIKTKLIGMQLLTTFVVLMFFAIYIVYDEWKEYQNSAVNQLTSTVQLLSSNSVSSLDFLDVFSAEEVLSSLETQTDIVNAWIYDSEGNLFVKYSKDGYKKFSFPKITQERIQFEKGYITISKKIIDDEEFLGILSLRLDAAERWDSLLRNIYIIILALFAGMIVTFVLASIVQKKISRPILKLTDKSEQVIKTGDYSIRIEQESSDEIGYLSLAFNGMLEQTQAREAELDSARDQLQTVLDTVPGTISWLDSDLNYLGVNRSLADVFKLNPEDFIGQHLGFRGSSPEFVDFVEGFFKSEEKQVYKEINSTANNKELTHLIIGQKYAKNKAAVFIGIDITKIKEAEKAIKVSEERLSLVLEASNTGIWDYDILNKQAYYSPRWKALLGYAEDEIKNTSEEWEKRLHPDEKKWIIQRFDNYLANPQGLFTLEYRLKHKDGSYKWAYDRALALVNEQGITYRLLGSMSDITKRKSAEEKIRESEDKYRAIFNSTGTAMMILEEDTTISLANDEFALLSGFSRKEIEGNKLWTEFVVEEDLQWMKQQHELRRIDKKEAISSYEFRFVNKDNDLKNILLSIGMIPGTKKSVASLLNITEIKHAQKLQQVIYNIGAAVSSTKDMTAFYKEVHNQLKNLLDVSNFYVGLYDEANNIITLPYVNEETGEIEEFSAEYTASNYVIQSNRSMLLTENDFQKLEKEGKVKLLGASSKIWLGVPLKIEDKVIGLIVVQSYDDENAYNQDDLALMEFVSGQIASSITRKQAEEALREAHNNLEIKVSERTKELADANVRLQELDRLKSMFLASMSHELRTPLNSILGFTGLLLMGMAGEMNEEQKKQLGMVKNSANHLLSLINDILDISKIESGKIDLDIEEFELQILINEIISETAPLANKKGLKIFSEKENDVYITSDRRRVKQILMNLTGNAIKFTDQGQVKISLHSLPAGNPQVTVTDSGMGINDDDLAKLFQPFQQVDMSSSKRFEGTGLGLYLCQKLVNILGGEISAVSEYGKGSAFTFSLPLRYK